MYFLTLLLTIGIFITAWNIYEIIPIGNESFCTNDGMVQYIPFLTDFYDKVKSGDSLFYSFSGGLGYNFWGTMSYYLMSPFTLIVLLFPRNYIPLAAQIIIALKMCFVALGMTYYLTNRFKFKNYLLISACSLAYTFSYYFLGYMYNFMWLDCIAILPFVLRGLERLNSRKGKIQYVLCLAYAMITNFYLAAIFCIFLFFYYIFIVEKYENIIQFVKNSITFLTFSILAAMIASVILIPMGINIMEMSTTRRDLPELELYNSFFYTIQRHLPFIDIKNLSKNNGDVNAFCTITVLYAAVLFVFNKCIPLKRKIGTMILTGLLFLGLNVSWINFALHGFYIQRQIPNRFAFLYIFLLICMAYETLNTLKGVSRQKILMTASIFIFILAILYYNMNSSDFITDSNIVKNLTFIYCTAIIILMIFLFIKQKQKIAIPLIIFIEACLCLTNFKTTSFSDSYLERNNYETQINEDKENAEFYRSELLTSDITNAPILYNMNGVTLFNSIINSKTASNLGQLGFASGENYYRYFGHTPITDAILGIKYLYSEYDENLPFNYEEKYTTNDINVYENEYILPIENTIDFSSLDSNFANKFKNLNNLTAKYGTLFKGVSIKTSMTLENTEGNIQKNDNSNYLISNESNGLITITLDPLEAENMYLYSKMNANISYSIKVNDKTVTSTSYCGYISYLGDITKDDKITITYQVKDAGTDRKLTIFAASMDKDVFLDFYNDSLENALTNQDIEGNKITGEISLSENKKMTFMIPYDKGWHIKVDGIEEELIDTNNGFCAVNLSAGEHDIELIYTPQGLEIGTAISILGILLLNCYYFLPPKTPKHKLAKH